MAYTCEFCSHKFSTKTALVHHTKTAKYCLKLRGQTSAFVCKVCDKKLSEKRTYEKHVEKCGTMEAQKKIEFLEKQVQEQKRQIAELLDKLENVAIQASKKSTTTNIVNLIPMTDDWLKESAELLTIEHIENGGSGYAKFASENSFKDRVKCLDVSRKILQYKDKDKLVRDQKGRKLAEKFFDSINTKNAELIEKATDEIKELLKDTNRSDLDALMDKTRRLIILGNDVSYKRTRLQEEFVRELCVLLG